jgi:hypothetical protein
MEGGQDGVGRPVYGRVVLIKPRLAKNEINTLQVSDCKGAGLRPGTNG